ncbi:MAG: hypothetical protein PWQ43_711 [Rikenellaceae bacterium]|nr:hypothetical protein [Rikenellaceae bacterium]
MKKIFIFSFVMIISFTNVIFAQNISIGARAGLNLSSVFLKQGSYSYNDNLSMLTGFHINPYIEYSFSDKFALEGGLSFQTRGFILNETDMIRKKITPHYLDIPINAKFYFNIGKPRIYVYAGPYLGIGLYGKEKQYRNDALLSERKLEWGQYIPADLNRIDFGINGGVGIDINNFSIGAQYGYGFLNVSTLDNYGFKMHNYVINISIGYKFDL